MYSCPNCGHATTPSQVKDGRCPHCPPITKPAPSDTPASEQVGGIHITYDPARALFGDGVEEALTNRLLALAADLRSETFPQGERVIMDAIAHIANLTSRLTEAQEREEALKGEVADATAIICALVFDDRPLTAKERARGAELAAALTPTTDTPQASTPTPADTSDCFETHEGPENTLYFRAGREEQPTTATPLESRDEVGDFHDDEPAVTHYDLEAQAVCGTRQAFNDDGSCRCYVYKPTAPANGDGSRNKADLVCVYCGAPYPFHEEA